MTVTCSHQCKKIRNKIMYFCVDWNQNTSLLYLSLITQRDALYKNCWYGWVRWLFKQVWACVMTELLVSFRLCFYFVTNKNVSLLVICQYTVFTNKHTIKPPNIEIVILRLPSAWIPLYSLVEMYRRAEGTYCLHL